VSILTMENVSFAYDRRTPVLRNLSIQFDQGGAYAVVGRSGAGKTTLLSLLGHLMRPTMGNIFFDGRNIFEMNEYFYRSHCVGLVFQNYNLLPRLSALENVELSMNIAQSGSRHKQVDAEHYLQKMGLTKAQANRRVLKLSGGQQQRVAIARAISTDAKVILADEPTGNLDKQTGMEVLDLMLDLAHNEGKCVVIVTHAQDIAMRCDAIFKLPLVNPVGVA